MYLRATTFYIDTLIKNFFLNNLFAEIIQKFLKFADVSFLVSFFYYTISCLV